MTKSGKFITFEGVEGAGKSTQIRLLAARLEQGGRELVITREPGGSPTAEVLRTFLLTGRAKPLGILGEAYLFAAARLDHIAETIRPALARGAMVLCDRFIDSTRVYQGVGGGLDAAVIDQLERAAAGDMRPDLTIVLDIPVELGLYRATRRAQDASLDRFEGEGIAIHEARRQGFLKVAAAEPERCVVVDGSLAPEAIAEKIWAIAAARLL